MCWLIGLQAVQVLADLSISCSGAGRLQQRLFIHSCAVGGMLLLPGPAIGLSLSSHRTTPSQAHIRLEFSKSPDERAMIPQASLESKTRVNLKFSF